MRDFEDLGRLLDPPGPPPERLRQRVLSFLDEPPAPARAARRDRWHSRWRLGLVAGLATVVAGGAVVAGTVEFGDVQPDQRPTLLTLTNAASLLTDASGRVRGVSAPAVRERVKVPAMAVPGASSASIRSTRLA